MLILAKVFYESVLQALQQLRANRLRSFLTLLGITIGIFCIIGVRSAVDSLENNIRSSFEKLGDDVVYIQKMPWNEDPHSNYWKYMRRPNPSHEDFEVIKKKVKTASLVDFHIYIGSKTVKYLSNSVNRVAIVGVTYDCAELFKLNFEKGRYYTSSEFHYGLNKIIIGHTVAEELFGQVNPIGRKVNLLGRKLEVIGVIEKSGKDIIRVLDFDEVILLSYELTKKIANVKTNHPFGATVNVKAAKGITLDKLKDDLTVALRSKHRLKPKEKDDFSLNNISILADIFSKIFGTMGVAGMIIGGFAIFIGMFSVANIMFVSVKERTNIIGIKKALGAKQIIILSEFLIESVILCVIGGAIGLLIIFSLTKFLMSTGSMPFEIFLSGKNIILGVGLSILIGIISGFIPALKASNMDPVEAIRQ